MLRKIHSIPGLIAALLMTIVALAGAALSVNPALEQASVRPSLAPLSVATLASRVSTSMPDVETLTRRPSGAIIAHYEAGGEQRASIIDPATGKAVGDYRPSPVERWLKNLHRKLFLGDAGRIATGATAAFMLFAALSGLVLLARRMGGWSHILAPIRGDGLQRLHNETARAALAGLTLSAMTGVVMSLTTFGVIPEGGAQQPALGVSAITTPPMPLRQMPALAIDVSSLRQLTFANAADPSSIIEVNTMDGAGYVDPSSGRWLAFQPADAWQRVHGVVRMLHTGEGLWWLGLILGASSASVPLLAATGLLLWLRRRRAMPKLAGNVPARDADAVLLLGTEGNSTWGFASALHAALTRAGFRVHVAPMNDFAAGSRSLRYLMVLTATYGDGGAPESAARFLPKLDRVTIPGGVAFGVLGFGDRQFPHFCGYARTVHEALTARGLEALTDLGTVDRQSEPEFRQWCAGLAERLGVSLDIRYTPLLPPTIPLKLVSRDDYGADPQDMTSVLRLMPAEGGRTWTTALRQRLPRFETGDLLGVVPPGATSPRYYSLASATADGLVEICVRRHPNGVCSGYLTGLQPGETIEAFMRPNARFRPDAGSAPVVLIGAGTGIGPLIGFIRHNAARRPMHLYFGTRNDGEGFLYHAELKHLVADRRLQALTTAFSRSGSRSYVQDRLIADAQSLRTLVAHGAQIMVCGGRRMAEGVAQAWERILTDTGLSVAQLRAQGRYVEDVY
ncbi:PepSY domain-containing protein [Cupriavidus consociatus]|uniref:PepSY domain-containing protein n=1 Tax=Cupriavidus consociatus TaxID=2821357 RepID=UPI001AE26A98|nr:MULTISPECIES: PepSY domain-containing protein [unclassified Cupriavidus]MBP0624821.1 PepSY domain-containing protein [Cupriavidus sp. LEh25]MDK2661547.1 PepSY domain-containing protein [Cupriavidus sp. LEh21]